MVSPLFTAFALIACGRVEVPPAPQQPPVPQIRGVVREDIEAKSDRTRARR
ncbi:MAG TPA: hypothetical protein VEW04_04130 [Allosphingosinicella sp.]|jgi:hypothetical protein|nr:hypothetical protein [Allosphingosinicella sp.]